jgi:hypothetical protein
MCAWSSPTPRRQHILTGIDDIIINDHYLIVIAIALLFTILTVYRRTVLLDLITAVLWFIAGATHLLASPTTTPFYSLSILWWGLGLIFFVLVWVDLFQIFNIKKKNDGVGPL